MNCPLKKKNPERDNIQLALDFAGIIPGWGAIADLTNAGIYAWNGEWSEAGQSAFGAIPGVGDAMMASKYGNAGLGLIFNKGPIPKALMDSKPKNSPSPDRWFDNGGLIDIDDNWKYIDWDGNIVEYVKDYPDFKGASLVNKEVNIGEFTTRSRDFRKADKISPKSKNSTWHHHEDGETLQEVNRDIHERFRHRGGFSLYKK